MDKRVSIPVLIVAAAFVTGCGSDSSTTPKDDTPPTFSKMMGSSGNGTEVLSVVVMSDGSTVVSGDGPALDITGSSTPLDGAGTSGVFFAGIKPDGKIGFRTFVPGTGFPMISAITRDANDNLLAIGQYPNNQTFGTTSLTNHGSSDILITKLDATGHPIWVQGAGGTGSDAGYDIAAASDGSVYVCGVVNGKVLIANEDTGVVGKSSGFLVKMQPGGSGAWRQTAAPATSAECTGVAVSHDGSVVVGGDYAGTDVTIGGVILPNDGSLNGFIARFDAAGVPLGNIRIGGTGAIAVTAVTTIGDDVVVGGAFSGTADFDVNTSAGVAAAVSSDAFVARYAKTGQFQWVQTFGTTDDQGVTHLARTSSGGVLACGNFHNTFSAGSTLLNSAGNFDIFVVRLSGGGAVQAVKQLGGPGGESVADVASTNDALIVAGTTDSDQLTFPDGTSRTNFGILDGFLYRQP